MNVIAKSVNRVDL